MPIPNSSCGIIILASVGEITLIVESKNIRFAKPEKWVKILLSFGLNSRYIVGIEKGKNESLLLPLTVFMVKIGHIH